LIGLKDATFIGRPYLQGARVVATVEERAKDKKVIIFKMRRRKNSKRLRGYRRRVTILRINDIVYDDILKVA
jgi:large subunit ribosomal protein L21